VFVDIDGQECERRAESLGAVRARHADRASSDASPMTGDPE
jgi:hypothetical protein